MGLAARPLHFLSVRPIARRLPEPASPGCGKIQLSLADVPRTRSRLIPVEVHDFRFPGSANSRSAPGFWNSALLAYCLCGSGKPGWRQTVLHSPRVWTEPAQSERKQVCAHYCPGGLRFPILTLAFGGFCHRWFFHSVKNLPETPRPETPKRLGVTGRQAEEKWVVNDPYSFFLLLGYTSVFGMCLPQTGY